MTPHRSAWVPFPALAVAWVAFAQVLSFQGLALWVIASSILTCLAVGAIARARHVPLAMVLGVLFTATVPLLARTFGGDSAGPIVRASLMAVGVSAAIAILLYSRTPATLLVASLILIGGALGLGAAGRVLWLVGLWAVAALLTLLMLTSYSRGDLSAARRRRAIALVMAATGLSGVLAVVGLASVFGTPWTMTGANTSPSASASASASAIVRPTPTSTPTPTAVPSPLPVVRPQSLNPVVKVVLIVVGALVAALLIVVGLLLLWRAWVGLLWATKRRRLRRGSPLQRITGAWTWVRLRRARYDRPLPISASPDVAAELAVAARDTDLAAVAHLAASASFDSNSAFTNADVASAWRAARAVGRRPRSAGARQRWRWSGRSPGATRSRLRSTADRS